ncbi:uncharacterized protein LACBIDRAFT_324653 [Laccaria bicolor S238N-H82]|uniref:Predicted protein n=1 Tax=Laccaria bicolor (strain S238N-H82 / ATCC MYA-4686) TaxID=486041 RepID=B0D2L5_LACBS|nr:uncharacterized protein LACBIDRAFT_324653 [Laccaria bicolor S238N-H82]EDR10770.1 predicted protein [Laccaria bicolor S238N-H82]|eukprot:XP_001878071.1 predicted protein [Laccaria bicolor S238N-H82]
MRHHRLVDVARLLRRQVVVVVVGRYWDWGSLYTPRVAHPPLPNGWRVQSYTLAMFFVAGLVQRFRGQLSYFHEIAAVHLALLGYTSVWFARTLQRNKFTWAHIQTIFRNIKFLRLPSNFGSLFIQGRLTAQTAVFFIALIFLSLDSACLPSPNDTSSSSTQVIWVTLFGFRVRAAIGLILPSLSSWTILVAFYIQYRRSSDPDRMLGMARNVLFVVFSWYWVEEVVSIERSMQENVGLDRFATEVDPSLMEFHFLSPNTTWPEANVTYKPFFDYA